MNKSFSKETWWKLAEVTLISLQLFNRRWAGEIERVYIEDFNSYQSIDKFADKETYATLLKHGQALARKYVRFMICGKLGRGVPVLIAANLLDCLILILKYRGKARVPENNQYLFGLPSKDRDRIKYYYDASLISAVQMYHIQFAAHNSDSMSQRSAFRWTCRRMKFWSWRIFLATPIKYTNKFITNQTYRMTSSKSRNYLK